MRWYVRSMADHDTHLVSNQPDGAAVIAVCGLEFEITSLTVILPGAPPDPEQICLICRRRLVGARPGEVKR